jgi:hypothetical protein
MRGHGGFLRESSENGQGWRHVRVTSPAASCRHMLPQVSPEKQEQVGLAPQPPGTAMQEKEGGTSNAPP